MTGQYSLLLSFIRFSLGKLCIPILQTRKVGCYAIHGLTMQTISFSSLLPWNGVGWSTSLQPQLLLLVVESEQNESHVNIPLIMHLSALLRYKNKKATSKSNNYYSRHSAEAIYGGLYWRQHRLGKPFTHLIFLCHTYNSFNYIHLASMCYRRYWNPVNHTATV